jgi:hypothetical protein
MTEEETARQLSELGCPYGAPDDRSRIWLDGYQAALQANVRRLANELGRELPRERMQ